MRPGLAFWFDFAFWLGFAARRSAAQRGLAAAVPEVTLAEVREQPRLVPEEVAATGADLLDRHPQQREDGVALVAGGQTPLIPRAADEHLPEPARLLRQALDLPALRSERLRVLLRQFREPEQVCDEVVERLAELEALEGNHQLRALTERAPRRRHEGRAHANRLPLRPVERPLGDPRTCDHEGELGVFRAVDELGEAVDGRKVEVGEGGEPLAPRLDRLEQPSRRLDVASSGSDRRLEAQLGIERGERGVEIGKERRAGH